MARGGGVGPAWVYSPPRKELVMCQELVLSVYAVIGSKRELHHEDELVVIGDARAAWRMCRAWRKDTELVGATPTSCIIKTRGGEFIGRWDND